jgi:cellulose synthase/poly-beta-1,6-N-acetylglucosamine synthase-like glycosyltransferase
MYVVERLIDNITQFNYPKDRFEIRVLDDSTDETVQITAKKVAEYKAKGFDIVQVTRTDRTGYKAGALKEDMKHAKGEFFAIFDADFLPEKDFLKRTIPHFSNPEIGVVQTRWGHINEDYSIITRLQAFQLNVHFTVEQVGRENGNYFLQFNGTGGVWRKKTIEDAGGWEEDLDLSVRAQLKGYKIYYLEDTVSPAELPAEMNGLKSQQHRWMKGGAETAKKLLPTVWKADLSFSKKFHATLHLLSSSIFLCVFIVGVFSVPVLFLMESVNFPMQYFAIFLTSMLSIMAVYYVGNVKGAWAADNFGKNILKFLFLFPVFLALSMGLSLHNSIAVLQGYRGKKSAFIRTPKFNLKTIADKMNQKNYLAKKIPFTTILEGVLCLYFIFAIVQGIVSGNMSFLLFHILLAIGYGSICFYSIKHLALR